MDLSILGVKVSNLRKNEILERIQGLFSAGRQVLVVTPNPEMLVLALKDTEFRELLNNADISLADGFGLSLAARIQGEKIIERITGTDFLIDVVRLAKKNNLAVYLLGGKNGAGEGAKKWLEQNNFEVNIEINEEEFSGDSSKNFAIFVPLGHGKQERVASELLSQHPNIVLAMGVGGAFDFLSGKVMRAPKIMRLIGMEWLFRLSVEPWRIKRIWN